MDTKWKKFSGSLIYKGFFISVIFIAIFYFCLNIVEWESIKTFNVIEHPKDVRYDFDYKSSFYKNFYYLGYKFGDKDLTSFDDTKEKKSENGINTDLESKIEYYVELTDGEKYYNTKSNKKIDFENKKHYFIYEVVNNNPHIYSTIKNDYNNHHKATSFYNYENKKSIKCIYITYRPSYVSEIEETFKVNYDNNMYHLIYAIKCLVVALICTIFLSISAGRNKNSVKNIIFIDKIPLVIFIVGCCVLMYMWLEFSVSIFRNLTDSLNGGITSLKVMMGFIFMAAPISYTILMMILSIVRRIKAKVFFKYTLVNFIIKSLEMGIKSTFDMFDKKEKSRTEVFISSDIAYIVISIFMVFSFILFSFGAGSIFIGLIIVFIELFITYIYIKYKKRIYSEVDSYVDKKVDKMLKSEKTKTELITGVSHDLKTPITSIIAYVDLLKKEDLNGKVKEYVDILDEKSNKLSVMVKDLFDIAKTASGEVQVEKTDLDLNKLVAQTIADMDDRIKESGFTIKVDYKDENISIKSDGKKLYRVLQNLIDNALKYSLNGTRIYIDIYKHDDKAIVVVKNTSSYSMDFNVDEIKMKFTRADSSRTKEGSGLGLAITNTFVTALDGAFDIVIDGDQFKAIIELPIE
ncbi:MAG: hypothetical protein CSB15_01785 [Clostridiales bacterium]|nr:MAG: hypothetical protein CSB15_01785 [Clostridiales bacterium]